MGPIVRVVVAISAVAAGLAVTVEAASQSVNFIQNANADHEYALQSSLPNGFGAAEFTLELWIKPDGAKPIGPVTPQGSEQQLVNWHDGDNQPYSYYDWWWRGNFLLDGHNNASFGDGTFSLQFYGGGRVRWDFGDGAAPTGGHWSVQAWPATNTASLLDGNWHQITCVRRWSGVSSADLELWVDGALVAKEISNLRTNMWTTYWSAWPGFPSGEAGWFWGSEKQAAILARLTQYEDYKGLVDEVRFWSRAKTTTELANYWRAPVTGDETGLIGWYPFADGTGPVTCNEQSGAECWSLINSEPSIWSNANAPIWDPYNPNYVYVNFTAPNTGNGSQAAPFKLLSQAIGAAAVGGTIEILPGSTLEKPRITKKLRIEKTVPSTGAVLIGKSTARDAPIASTQTGFVSAPKP